MAIKPWFSRTHFRLLKATGLSFMLPASAAEGAGAFSVCVEFRLSRQLANTPRREAAQTRRFSTQPASEPLPSHRWMAIKPWFSRTHFRPLKAAAAFTGSGRAGCPGMRTPRLLSRAKSRKLFKNRHIRLPIISCDPAQWHRHRWRANGGTQFAWSWRRSFQRNVPNSFPEKILRLTPSIRTYLRPSRHAK